MKAYNERQSCKYWESCPSIICEGNCCVVREPRTSYMTAWDKVNESLARTKRRGRRIISYVMGADRKYQEVVRVKR